MENSEKKVRTTTRVGVLETNSSSSHSIAITKELGEDLMDTIIPDDEGVINLVGDFHWEFAKYDDAYTKAAYIIQQSRYASNERNDKIDNLLGEKETYFNKVIRVIKEQTGATDVLLGDVSIDHQSHGVGDEVFSDDEAIRQFIFNRKSILYTGNDNSDQVWDHATGELVTETYDY